MQDYLGMKTIQPNKNSPGRECYAPGLMINGENLPFKSFIRGYQAAGP